MSIRILHILDHSLPLHSGYAFRSNAIRREQDELGWQTYWLTTPKQGESEGGEESFEGQQYFRTPGSDSDSLFAQMRATAARLRELIPVLQPDVIQAHSPVLNVLPALWVRRTFGIPVVYERRSSWEDAAATRGTSAEGGMRYRMSRLLETIAFRQADAITTICDGLRQDITARGIDARKVTLIPNAVDVERFQTNRPIDRSLADSLALGNATVLGYAGSFSPYEGLELLLQAVGRLAVSNPTLKVLLVGAGGNEAELRALAIELGLQDRVVFTGRVEHADIMRYYSLVDIFVYPRHSTRLTNMVTPLKPLEAMAEGRLVLASDVGGHRELIRDRYNGYLFKADSDESLANAIQALIENRDAWPDLQRNGRHYVESERTWKHSISAYREVYERIMTRSTARPMSQVRSS